MDDTRIRELVAALETTKFLVAEEVWLTLRPLGPRLLPFFLEFYPKMGKWQGRLNLVYHAIPLARDHEEAFQLGIAATQDRAVLVRYRACMLLAYALDTRAIPHLKRLLVHKDQRTVDDAKAAIDAIKHRNHHYFIDRDHSGRLLWQIVGFDEQGG